MKNFHVTVNGQPYDVTVEEIGAGAAAAPVFKTAPQQVSAPRPSAPTPRPAPQAAPVAPLAPAATSKPVAKAAAAGGNSVSAPMPGVVLSVMVNVGQKVKANDVLLILEAMKMENEVTAPVAGTIIEVVVSKGTSVNTGDLMVVIE